MRGAMSDSATPQTIQPQRLIEIHTEAIDGGVGLTTLGNCGVSADARIVESQMYFRPEIKSGLQELTGAVHARGGKISSQLTHSGYFKQNKPVRSTRPL